MQMSSLSLMGLQGVVRANYSVPTKWCMDTPQVNANDIKSIYYLIKLLKKHYEYIFILIKFNNKNKQKHVCITNKVNPGKFAGKSLSIV